MTETWTWQISKGAENAPGTGEPFGASEAEGLTETAPGGQFPSQAEAEAWLSESWQELLAADVEAVTLLRDGEPVYGPMSLRSAQ